MIFAKERTGLFIDGLTERIYQVFPSPPFAGYLYRTELRVIYSTQRYYNNIRTG